MKVWKCTFLVWTEIGFNVVLYHKHVRFSKRVLFIPKPLSASSTVFLFNYVFIYSWDDWSCQNCESYAKTPVTSPFFPPGRPGAAAGAAVKISTQSRDHSSLSFIHSPPASPALPGRPPARWAKTPRRGGNKQTDKQILMKEPPKAQKCTF